MRHTKIGLLLAFSLAASAAVAQTSPGLRNGQVPTAAQWNSYFAAKQDALGYTPLNRSGDTMLGRLTISPATSGGAGLNMGQGVTPSTPNNGDVWLTTSGLFYTLNGVTYGPLATGSSPTGAALAVVSDTNVALALSGTPLSALLQSATVTASWAGQLSIARGGTASSTANAARHSLGTYGDIGTGYGDVSTAIASTDRVAYTTAALTAPRTWTLPAANVTGNPYSLLVEDMAGGVGATNTLTVTRAGSDTVNGGTSVAMNAANSGLTCSSDGTSKWSCQSLGTSTGTVTGGSYPLTGSPTMTYVGPTSSGRLSVTSTTQLTFAPFNGDTIRIAGVVYQIPSAGVTTGCTTSGLSATTLYYVYIRNNSGTLNCEISATGHSTDTTAGNVGTEVKTGDNSRSLVGMIYTAAGPTFVDADATRYLLNWFNRRVLTGVAQDSTDSTTTSASFVTKTPTASFLTWANNGVTITNFATVQNSAGGTQSLGISLDGGGASVWQASSVSSGAIVGMGVTYSSESLAEGQHSTSMAVRTNAGTLTLQGSSAGPTTISVRIFG